MAKVNLELGKFKLIAPDKEAELTLEGIKLSAEYSADELQVIKSIFESAFGVSSNNDLKLEIEEIKNLQVSSGNMIKDLIGTFMTYATNQTKAQENQVGAMEQIAKFLGKLVGYKEEDAISSEELETRKQRVEFFKSSV